MVASRLNQLFSRFLSGSFGQAKEKLITQTRKLRTCQIVATTLVNLPTAPNLLPATIFVNAQLLNVLHARRIGNVDAHGPAKKITADKSAGRFFFRATIHYAFRITNYALSTAQA